MRRVLICLCLMGLGATVWHAAAVKAPAIEADLSRRASATIPPLARHLVEARAVGRQVRISGLADSVAERREMLAAARGLEGAAGVIDHLRVLPVATPYEFRADKTPERLTLSGVVPEERSEAVLRDAAHSAMPEGRVTVDLLLAAGAPEGDWTGMVATGLRALGALERGALRIADSEAHLSGIPAGAATRARLEAMLAEAPMGDWRLKLAQQGNAGDGAAPPAADTADAAESPEPGAAADAANPEDPGPENHTAEPPPARPATPVATAAPAAAAIAPTAGDNATGPPDRGADSVAALTLELAPGAGIRAAGRMPEGFELADLSRSLPDLAGTEEVSADARGDPERWRHVLEALNIALPRIAEGVIEIGSARVRAEGELKPGFSIAATRAALRSALGPDWELAFEMEESPPPARLSFAKGTDGVRVTGILPHGLAVAQALAALGGEADGALTSGGLGDHAQWTAALGALGRVLRAYRSAEGAFGPEHLAIDGRMAPGQDPEAIAHWLETVLGEDREIRVAGEAPAATEGAVRYNPVTDRRERLIEGHWLPVLDFAPDRAACGQAAARAQSGAKITFVTGSARIDPAAAPVLDHLAAIARRCLGAGGLWLEVGGHTDAVGGTKANRALSEKRAEAVRAALIKRGVPAKRVHARGFGEAEPIADNDTPESRARNRRISFAWLNERPAEPSPAE